jgi:hypothetical protein
LGVRLLTGATFAGALAVVFFAVTMFKPTYLFPV